MMDEWDKLLARLHEAKVDFIIIGGLAAVAHGFSISTQDIDICCDFSAENLLRLQRAITDLNPVHRMTPNKIKLTLTPENCIGLKNLYLRTDAGQLDCIGEVAGLGDFNEVKKHGMKVAVEGKDYAVLNLDALIQAKKALNRPKDREVIQQLEAIKELKGEVND